MLQALAEQARMVRLPLNKIGVLNKIDKTASHLMHALEREPTTEELAEIMDMSADDLAYALTTSSRYISLDAPLGFEEEGSLLDVMKGDDHESVENNFIKDEHDKEAIKRLCKMLSDKEKKILGRFFGVTVILSGEVVLETETPR